MGSARPVAAQPDSVRTRILMEKGYPPNHSPRGALWRSLAAPGWGQIYNRQYYKLPFVAGGLGGLGYAVYTMNQDYVLHRHAAIFARGQSLANQQEQNPDDPPEIPDVISDWESFRDDYAQVVREAGGSTDNLEDLPLSASQLRSQRDKFRRYRDLSIVGVGLFYALTMVDAYVSAHLLSFDVDEELAVTVYPTGRLPAGPRATPSLASEAAPGRGDALSAERETLPVERALTMGPGVSLRVRF